MKNFVLPEYFKPYTCSNLIRIGKNNDGGYLVDETSMIKTNVLLSFGIDHDWSFEENFYLNTNCLVHAYDGSVGLIFFIKKLKMRIKGMITKPNKDYFEVSKYWFRLPINFYKFFNVIKDKKGPNHYEKFVGNKKNFITFNETLENIPIEDKKIYLKIDIEGNEYSLLDEIIKNEELFTGLVIELHEVNKNIKIIENFINLFALKIVHIHINNYGEAKQNKLPDVIELTFSRFSNSNNIGGNLPHSLDQSNDINSWPYKIEFLNQ